MYFSITNNYSYSDIERATMIKTQLRTYLSVTKNQSLIQILASNHFQYKIRPGI